MSRETPWSAGQLLNFLRERGGQEFRAVTLRREKQGKTGVWQATATYRLTARGDVIEATGPSGQTRPLTPERFLEVFGTSHFRPAVATGRLTDLGPLFGD